MREFYPFEIIVDIAPGVTTGMLGYALEQEGEPAEGDVSMDTVDGPVIDWT